MMLTPEYRAWLKSWLLALQDYNEQQLQDLRYLIQGRLLRLYDGNWAAMMLKQQKPEQGLRRAEIRLLQREVEIELAELELHKGKPERERR